MNLCALVLVAALTAPDGGVPFEDADAGVYQVDQASTPDGGTLGPGWWLAPERMRKVGVQLNALEAENLDLKTQQVKLTWGFWVGMGVGAVVGAGTVLFIVHEVR